MPDELQLNSQLISAFETALNENLSTIENLPLGETIILPKLLTFKSGQLCKKQVFTAIDNDGPDTNVKFARKVLQESIREIDIYVLGYCAYLKGSDGNKVFGLVLEAGERDAKITFTLFQPFTRTTEGKIV